VTGSVLGKAGGSSRRAIGKAGEDSAVAWYEARGYEVLARNWSCRDGELDIVLRQGRFHVFCEVKARSSGAFGLPAEAVGPLKQARVRRLAALWFAELSRSALSPPSGAEAMPARAGRAGRGARPGGPVRFDVASVLDGEVTVIEGAF
jgi:putative endonuclease